MIIGENGRAGGSSPRVRGTHVIIAHGNGWVRFIPAGAGNTAMRAAIRLRMSVHPRGCGEHEFAHYTDAHQVGSSPRVRGTHEP